MFAATAPRMNSRNRNIAGELDACSASSAAGRPTSATSDRRTPAARTARRSPSRASSGRCRRGTPAPRPASAARRSGRGRRGAGTPRRPRAPTARSSAGSASRRRACRSGCRGTGVGVNGRSAVSTMTPVAANVRSKRPTMAVSPASPAVTRPSSSTVGEAVVVRREDAEPGHVARRAVGVLGDELDAVRLARLEHELVRHHRDADDLRRDPSRRPARPAESRCRRWCRRGGRG